jgi:hypothetical protein
VSRARRKPWEEWSRSEEDEEGGMVAARGREATLEKREREREKHRETKTETETGIEKGGASETKRNEEGRR